jgi:arylsulfatase A-like enzyme
VSLPPEHYPMNRRRFLQTAGATASAATVWPALGRAASPAAAADRPEAGRGPGEGRPNIVYVFADQWRAQATGYAGDPNARTPALDRLASRSIQLTTAVSTCPVCSPYRASLMTGRYALTHGVFINDVPLSTEAVSIAQAFGRAGYKTGYIGKWHIDGRGRTSFIPPERRQGFEFWRTLECIKNFWDGYDAIAQTREAQGHIREHAGQGPFLLMLSWGPPHNPYETAPEEYAARFKPDDLKLRPNVPQAGRSLGEGGPPDLKPSQAVAATRRDLAGYYAHCAALDDCVGRLWDTLRETGIEENTIFVFTSDHGDMLGSQGEQRKQRPWDESIRVPFLIHWPRLTKEGRTVATPIGTPDIMPTLLGLAGIQIPPTVEGTDFSAHLRGAASETRSATADLQRGGAPAGSEAALIACYTPFGEWQRGKGGREYRGIRTARHTFVRSLDGPWLLYDNESDPYQQKNLCNLPEHAALQQELDALLQAKLRQAHDDFQPGAVYLKKWNYAVDKTGTMPYGP